MLEDWCSVNDLFGYLKMEYNRYLPEPHQGLQVHPFFNFIAKARCTFQIVFILATGMVIRTVAVEKDRGSSDRRFDEHIIHCAQR